MKTQNIQDIRVDSFIKLPEPPPVNTLFNLVFVFKGAQDANLLPVNSQEDLDNLSLPENVLSQVGFYNKNFYILECLGEKTLQSQINKVGDLAFTIQLDEALYNDYFDNNVSFKGFTAFALTLANPWEDEKIKQNAHKERICIYSSGETQDQKLWFCLNTLLNSPKGYPFLENVINLELPFSSNYSKSQRDLLLEAGLSFSVDSLQGVKNFDLYAGGVQMKAVFGLFIAQFEFNAIYEKHIDQGTKYTDSNISKIEVSIAARAKQLADRGVIGDYEISSSESVASQTDANKVLGIFVANDKTVHYEYDLSIIKYKIQGAI